MPLSILLALLPLKFITLCFFLVLFIFSPVFYLVLVKYLGGKILQLAAAECGCHNHGNVLIISAIYTCLCSPTSSSINCCLISEQKLPIFLMWAELF